MTEFFGDRPNKFLILHELYVGYLKYDNIVNMNRTNKLLFNDYIDYDFSKPVIDILCPSFKCGHHNNIWINAILLKDVDLKKLLENYEIKYDDDNKNNELYFNTLFEKYVF